MDINHLRKLAGLPFDESASEVETIIDNIGKKFGVDFSDEDGENVRSALKAALKIDPCTALKEDISSSVFETELDKLQEILTTASFIADSQEWHDYMAQTDMNFDSAASRYHTVLVNAITKAKLACTDLSHHLHNID